MNYQPNQIYLIEGTYYIITHTSSSILTLRNLHNGRLVHPNSMYMDDVIYVGTADSNPELLL